MDFVMTGVWLATFTLLSCFTGCVAPPGACGYVPSTFVYPLGEVIGATETMTGTPGSTVGTEIAPGNPELDYNATWFAGPASSASLLLNDPVALPGGVFPEDYAFQFMFYPEAGGDVLRYQADTAVNVDDITTIIVTLNGNAMSVTLESVTNSDTQLVGHTVTYNQWYWMAVGRDGSRNVVFVRIDGTEYQLDFAAWTDGGRTTMTPGHFTVGAGFVGRLTCLQVILTCRSLEVLADYYTECNSPSWPAVIPIPGLTPAIEPVKLMEQCGLPNK